MSVSPQAQEIWDLIKENQKGLKELRESQKETDEQIKRNSAEMSEKIKETNEQIKRNLAETSEQIKKNSAETSEKIKETRSLFETQWGKLMESLVEGDLINILNECGIEVINIHTNVKHRSEKDGYEYDILAVNGKEVVVVEVKTTLRVKHVKYFLEDLKKFPVRLHHFKDFIIYGAVAYLRAEEEAVRYSEKQGLFVIRATGSSASLVNKKGFKPKVFS